MDLSLEQINWLKEWAISFWMTYIPPLVGAVVVLYFWLKAIKRWTNIIRKILTKGHFDITIAKFVSNLINFALKALLVITVAGMIWVETTSFVAIIWAAWLAVWLALQWSLANFAGWMLILLFKPYQVGDWILIDGELGKVDEIDILLTRMTTRDHKIVIIPNGEAANGKIVNWTKKWPMRIWVPIWISYDASIDDAKATLLEVMSDVEHIAKTPEPSVVVTELADSYVTLEMRCFARAQYEPVIVSELLEKAKKALDKAKIEIPYPQMVVHKG